MTACIRCTLVTHVAPVYFLLMATRAPSQFQCLSAPISLFQAIISLNSVFVMSEARTSRRYTHPLHVPLFRILLASHSLQGIHILLVATRATPSFCACCVSTRSGSALVSRHTMPCASRGYACYILFLRMCFNTLWQRYFYTPCASCG